MVVYEREMSNEGMQSRFVVHPVLNHSIADIIDIETECSDFKGRVRRILSCRRIRDQCRKIIVLRRTLTMIFESVEQLHVGTTSRIHHVLRFSSIWPIQYVPLTVQCHPFSISGRLSLPPPLPSVVCISFNATPPLRYCALSGKAERVNHIDGSS